jgi:predicted TIM-barrel fold metal-dependent hydrolase
MRCDSHIHVVGPPERYTQVPNRTFLAGQAPLSEVERVAAARNVHRFVIVQPSFYGTDNSLLLESLDALAGRGRGVSVIEPGALTARELLDFARRGVRGLRIDVSSPVKGAERIEDRFQALESLARTLDWHLEVIAPLKVLAQAQGRLAGSRVPIVIDHYGLYSGYAPHRGEGRMLLELLSLPHVWMKLSAPYRSSFDPLATHPDAIWLAEFVRIAPDRCVWGSDWPHTPPDYKQEDGERQLPYRMLRYEAVFDDFCHSVMSAELLQRILVDNPARLYGF